MLKRWSMPPMTENARPIFIYIVSSPHGGSTLLSHVLGKHGAAVNLGEVSFLPKLIALSEPCSCGSPIPECDYWSQVLEVFEKNVGANLLKDPYSVHLGDAPKGRLGSGLIDKNHQSKLRFFLMKARGALDTLSVLYAPRTLPLRMMSLPSITAGARATLALFEAAAEHTGSRIIVDASKMPRKAAHLYQAAPDQVRIIHLTRDGRGVAASRKRYMPVSHAAERWAHYHRLSERTLERWVPEQHRTQVSYEEFVAHPQQTLRTLFAWLGEEYDAECLVFDKGRISHAAGGNPARFELSGGIRPADDRWRRELTEAELGDFEHAAGKQNKAFGYE